jgi:hypothetical protein
VTRWQRAQHRGLRSGLTACSKMSGAGAETDGAGPVVERRGMEHIMHSQGRLLEHGEADEHPDHNRLIIADT